MINQNININNMNKKRQKLKTKKVLIIIGIVLILSFGADIISKNNNPIGKVEQAGAESDVYDAIVDDEIELVELDLNQQKEVIGEIQLRLEGNHTITNVNGNLLNSLIN
jgi:hypothetical protein